MKLQDFTHDILAVQLPCYKNINIPCGKEKHVILSYFTTDKSCNIQQTRCPLMSQPDRPRHPTRTSPENLSTKVVFCVCCRADVISSSFFLNRDPLNCFVRKIIKLTLYINRGQCIEWSPQTSSAGLVGACLLAGTDTGLGRKGEGNERRRGVKKQQPLSGRCRCLQIFWQAGGGRAGRVFWPVWQGVRGVLLRQDLLAQCHPLPASRTVHVCLVVTAAHVCVTC